MDKTLKNHYFLPYFKAKIAQNSSLVQVFMGRVLSDFGQFLHGFLLGQRSWWAMLKTPNP